LTTAVITIESDLRWLNDDMEPECDAVKRIRAHIDGLQHELNQARFALTASEKDAARYRWIRKTDGEYAMNETIQRMWLKVQREGRRYPSREEWDAAFDTEIEKENAK